jgi:hypothetical protein
MSEKHPVHHERVEHHKPNHEHLEHQPKNHEKELTHAEKSHGKKEHVEHLTKKVEQQAISREKIAHTEKEQPKQHPVIANKQLKDMAFIRAMTRVRKKLPAPSRAFSKIAHNSAVDRISETTGKTIARPSGLIAGSFIAFVGTSALLWITRYYGYEYNYLVALLLFAGGMMLGLLGEGLYKLIKNR